MRRNRFGERGRLIHGSLSLFDFEPGQYERSMGTSPAAGQTARRRLLTQPLNSAAGDGRRHGRVCRSIVRPRIGGVLFLRCRSHALTMARRIGRLPRSLDGVLAVPSQRLSTLLSMIDKVFMLQHSCRAVASNRPRRSNEQKKTRKEATRCCSHSHAFCVFLVSLLTFPPIPTSSRPFRRREGTLIPYVSPFLPNLRHPEYRYSIPERPGSCVGGIFPAFARRDQRLARCP